MICPFTALLILLSQVTAQYLFLNKSCSDMFYTLSQKRCFAMAETNSSAKFGLFAAKTTPAKLFSEDT